MPELEEKQLEDDEFDPYCNKCGGCGFIGCCGITEFLDKHVKGKTDCQEEDMFLQEIIMYVNGELPEEMKQEYLEKCSQCKSKKCSGWHRMDKNHQQ